MYQKEKNRNEIWEFVKAAFFFYFAVMGFLHKNAGGFAPISCCQNHFYGN